jgi:tRNA A37 threonylcarbamoyladenosine dehydratase
VFQKLVSHNKDIEKLVKRGFAVGFNNNCLIIRDIPYLDSEKQLQIGAFVAKLNFIDPEHVTQVNHQIFFSGSIPHGVDGKPIPNLAVRPNNNILDQNCSDVIVKYSFSNKPRKSGKFTDFYEKIDSYFTIVCGPALALYDDYNPFTFRIVKDADTESVFKFNDTMTSRAEISDLSNNFNEEIIAIIGTGGTGSYILDFIIKTPVKEIRIFDLDIFCIHNAYRSPGKTVAEEFGKKKVEIYKSRYDNFRKGITATPKYIDSSCDADFDDITFAFVCVDKGSSRKNIFDLLISKNIPFIDVGMGLNRKHNSLNGMIRTTFFSSENNQYVRDKKFAEESDNQNDLYRANIQIGELNALNACLAVIKYKQFRGFYYDEEFSYNLLLEIGDLKIVGESETERN